MTYVINVTQEDIDEGKPVVCNECPVALAIARALPGCEIHVLGTIVIVNGMYYQLPDECLDFVTRFDDGKSVSPFSFTLEITGGVTQQ
jgi:hypothetical protein